MLATVYAFLSTWLLHAYQFMWLGGTTEFSVPDSIFWWLLETLVLGTALWEQWRGPRRAAQKAPTGCCLERPECSP